MGKLSPLDLFPLLWNLSPQISIRVHLQLAIIFNIHHLHITSLSSRSYITFKYTSLIWGPKIGMLQWVGVCVWDNNGVCLSCDVFKHLLQLYHILPLSSWNNIYQYTISSLLQSICLGVLFYNHRLVWHHQHSLSSICLGVLFYTSPFSLKQLIVSHTNV